MVMVEIKINDNQSGIRLDKFLLSKYSKMRIVGIQKFIKKKEIKVNNRKVNSDYLLKNNDVITFSTFVEKILNNPINTEEIEKFTSEKIDDRYNKLVTDNIIYEDNNILVINKPYNLPVQGGTGIKVSVDKILKNLNTENTNLKLVHRLDRDTTGVLLIAKNFETANKLTKMFKTKEDIKKEYLLVVSGKINSNEGTISLPLIKKYENNVEKVYVDKNNGKEAITKYKVLFYSTKYDVSVVQANILTGRTHQIRVHFKEIGHPILGDFKYSNGINTTNNLNTEGKLQLHSYKTTINIKHERREFVAPIPEQMKNIFKTMGFSFNL